MGVDIWDFYGSFEVEVNDPQIFTSHPPFLEAMELALEALWSIDVVVTLVVLGSVYRRGRRLAGAVLVQFHSPERVGPAKLLLKAQISAPGYLAFHNLEGTSFFPVRKQWPFRQIQALPALKHG